MGMTILQAQQRLHEKWMELTKDGKDEEMMQALSIADTVLGNYDESLKADMMAMLTEIQAEIHELETYDIERTHGLIEDSYAVEDVNKVIRQKINELKGEKDDKNN